MEKKLISDKIIETNNTIDGYIKYINLRQDKIKQTSDRDELLRLVTELNKLSGECLSLMKLVDELMFLK
jgi:hypothetical protein